MFGIGITHLTSLRLRDGAQNPLFKARDRGTKDPRCQRLRQLYAGNIWFERMQPQRTDGKCSYCRASQKALNIVAQDRNSRLCVYSHQRHQVLGLASYLETICSLMLMIVNPPCPVGRTAATALMPRQSTSYSGQKALGDPPHGRDSFGGGKGLDKYRARMLSDKRMRAIVDYPKAVRRFSGVRGGERGQRNRDRDQVRLCEGFQL